MDISTKKVEQEVRFWKYDDGSFGFIVVQKQYQGKFPQEKVKRKCLDCGVCKDKDQLKAMLDGLQRQCTTDGYDFQKKRLKIKNGLQCVSKHDFSEKDEEIGKRGWEELKRFLDSCGTNIGNKKEVLRLFSGVLSGYCARMVIPLIQKCCLVPLQDRAPVLVLNSNEKTFNVTFDFVSKAMVALTVPTHTKGKLRCECPVFLPQFLEQKSLDQCAFLRYRKEKKQIPAQYRDTAVLVYGRYFPANEIYRFIERNRWAVVTLFDAPSKAYKTPTIRLKVSSLVCSDFRWDAEDINYLVERFVLSLSKLWSKKKRSRNLQKRLDRIQEYFLKYYAQQGIQRFNPTDVYFTMLQMLTLELFLDSCTDEKIIDKTQRQQAQSEWFNLLLPGCGQFLKPEEETISHELQSEEDHSKQVFQNALIKMLVESNLVHFVYVKPSDIFEETDPNDPSIIYWGYLRWYGPKRKRGERKKPNPFRALQFKEDQFKESIADFLTENYVVDDLIADLWSSKPEYLFSTSKARFDGKTLEKALIFEIEKMEFLPEEVRNILVSMIPDKA